MKVIFWAVVVNLAAVINGAQAGNCLIRGEQKIGDCTGVNVGPSKPLTVEKSGFFSGNYGDVLIKTGAIATISGNTSNITVEQGASLYFSGNSSDIFVSGKAEIDGNANQVTVNLGGTAVLKGIVESVRGQGKVIRARGSIVDGDYKR